METINWITLKRHTIIVVGSFDLQVPCVGQLLKQSKLIKSKAKQSDAKYSEVNFDKEFVQRANDHESVVTVINGKG